MYIQKISLSILSIFQTQVALVQHVLTLFGNDRQGRHSSTYTVFVGKFAPLVCVKTYNK